MCPSSFQDAWLDQRRECDLSRKVPAQVLAAARTHADLPAVARKPAELCREWADASAAGRIREADYLVDDPGWVEEGVLVPARDFDALRGVADLRAAGGAQNGSPNWFV